MQREWKKEDERLKKKGVSKKNRPSAPAPNPEYPTKAQLALQLMEQFRHCHSQITVKAVVADALYGQQSFMDAASALFDGCQVVSQLRNNQNIRYRNRKYQVSSYFAKFQGISRSISIRGQEPLNAMVASARLEVCAHAKKRFVIALKYPGEKEYRYLVATDLSWRTLDIVQAYSLRWLVEVFIEDWKGYEGWAQLAKQQGKEGSSRGLSLSLLLDLCLLLHPEQLTRVENNLPAYTVGSLQRTIQMEALVVGIKQIVHSPNSAKQLALLTQSVKDFFVLRSSSKHMSGKDLGRLEPTPSLRHRAAA
ncbi:MAG: transposase [Pleurocapsa sp. MO_226.B13]|nr:transposase [Pleurocapsa sp. MO_226.B13]